MADEPTGPIGRKPLAKLLGIHESTLLRMVQDGRVVPTGFREHAVLVPYWMPADVERLRERIEAGEILDRAQQRAVRGHSPQEPESIAEDVAAEPQPEPSEPACEQGD